MFYSKELIENILKLSKRKSFRWFIIGVVAICLFLFGIQLILNFWIRASLLETLGWGSGPQVKITAHLSWLSLGDLITGRVGWVRIDGENCLISNLVFAKLHLENQGFTYNRSVLFKEKRLELLHVNKTRIDADITSQAFSDYLNLFFPQFKPEVKISQGELALKGQMQIFGNIVPTELVGSVKIASAKTLRFYPGRLFISGHPVPANLLSLVSSQIPLQFSLMEDWPLAIKAVILKDGYVIITFTESS